MMKQITTTVCATVLMASCCNINNTEQQVNQQVDELYSRMSQPERIAQLRSGYMDELFDAEGNLDTVKCKQLIPYGIGHFSQYASQELVDANFLRKRVAVVQDWLMHHTPNGIPALFHEEVLSGINTQDATVYPQQIGQACSFNPELAELKTLQTGTALRKMGGVLSLSPMVDVCRTPSFNRLEESYGEDGYLSAVMGTAFVKGLQQGDLKKGVGACSKHYLGYGGGGDADEKEMMEDILLPHETMIRLAGCKALMPGYHAVHGTKCVANSEILNDILRDYLGFDGMVVSDYTAIDQLPGLDTPLQKAVAAINGGNDVDFPRGENYQYLQEALDKGLVKKEVFERAVKDVLRYKIRAGLMDKNPYLYSTEDVKLDTKEERQTVYEPICYNYSIRQDARVEWPFGYGLSYTTFAYKNLQAVRELSTASESSNIYFEVTNTGKVRADEIAQVYLSPTQSNQQIHPIQLQGFARISLNPGETKRVCIRFYTDQFGYYSHRGNRQWNIAPGTYELKIGASSQDIRLKQQIVLTGDKVVKPLRDHYFSEVIR